MFDTESGQIASETRSLHGQKSRVPLEPGTEKAASGTRSLRGQKGRIASEPGVGEFASGTRSLRGQKGRIALEPGTGEAASGTRSLCGQKEERLALDTSKFMTYIYLGKKYTKLISLYVRYSQIKLPQKHAHFVVRRAV